MTDEQFRELKTLILEGRMEIASLKSQITQLRKVVDGYEFSMLRVADSCDALAEIIDDEKPEETLKSH